ncbi:hypothetical protein [Cupriavidus sp. UME77]|uniref:hypothetical protein n=1 Tax=Cupriavidus sp. UME77 TaxID=1862321 RepID=UPI001602006C|nr:hypothetical protein [Cupriavidus sp. UME77]MBB1630279.1 hypothetical protein [Cupriavidus sp. UME77]
MSTKRGIEKLAFVRGFFDGMAAPMLLYRAHNLPEIPRIEPVKAPSTPLDRVLASDWRQIGSDIDTVIERHVEATAKK